MQYVLDICVRVCVCVSLSLSISLSLNIFLCILFSLYICVRVFGCASVSKYLVCIPCRYVFERARVCASLTLSISEYLHIFLYMLLCSSKFFFFLFYFFPFVDVFSVAYSHCLIFTLFPYITLSPYLTLFLRTLKWCYTFTSV